MIPAHGSFRGSRGACFAQVLMKNLPATTGLSQTCKAMSSMSISYDQNKEVLHQQPKSTYRHGEFHNDIGLILPAAFIITISHLTNSAKNLKTAVLLQSFA